MFGEPFKIAGRASVVESFFDKVTGEISAFLKSVENQSHVLGY